MVLKAYLRQVFPFEGLHLWSWMPFRYHKNLLRNSPVLGIPILLKKPFKRNMLGKYGEHVRNYRGMLLFCFPKGFLRGYLPSEKVVLKGEIVGNT